MSASSRCRRRNFLGRPEWDGVARYHDGTPIVEIQPFLRAEMAAYDRLSQAKRDSLKENFGIALEEEHAARPPMTGMS